MEKVIKYSFVFIFLLTCSDIDESDENVQINQGAIESGLENELLWRINLYNLKKPYLNFGYNNVSSLYGVMMYIYPTLYDVQINSIDYSGDTMIITVRNHFEYKNNNVSIDTSHTYHLGINRESFDFYWIHSIMNFNAEVIHYFSEDETIFLKTITDNEIKLLIEKSFLLNQWFRDQVESRHIDSIYIQRNLNLIDTIDWRYNLSMDSKPYL